MDEHFLPINESEHAGKILRRLNSMRKNEKNCDLVIMAEGRKTCVNRDVMCAASDYFDAMFSHDMKEKQEGVVEMKDAQFSAVEKCIDFILSGTISVTEEDCAGLLYCARLMQLNEICDKICPFLESRLTMKSFFIIRATAVKFSLTELIAVCDNFALDRLFPFGNGK